MFPNRGAGDTKSWPVDVPADGAFTADDIVISKGLVLSGVVRDTTGKPAANAKVTAQASSDLWPRKGVSISDAEGKYEIAGLNPKNSYEVRVENGPESSIQKLGGFPDHPITQSKLVTLDSKTKPTIVLYGKVMFDGKPYPDLPIFLDNTNHFIREVAATKTDAEGRYRLSGLFPGNEYRVRIDPPIPLLAVGWQHQSPYVNSVPKNVKKEMELEDMNLVRLNQTVSGRVIDSNGKPVEGATI